MTTLILLANLFLSPGATTDDDYDCYKRSDGVEVCERTLWPCHYEHSPDECVVRVVKIPTRVATP